MIFHITSDRIGDFKSIVLKHKTLWVPVLSDVGKHYSDSGISFIYVYCFETEQQYIASFTHNDYTSISDSEFFDGLIGDGVYVYNHRVLGDRLPNAVDASMLHWYFQNGIVDLTTEDQSMFTMYRRWFPGVSWLVDCIPAYQLIGWCQTIRGLLRGIDSYDLSEPGFRLYHDLYLPALVGIEQSGICFDAESLRVHFNVKVSQSINYPEIASYTATGRPTVSFKRINLNSLNKTTGERSIIRSRVDDGRLVEFDYDSYHLRLVADLIGYELPSTNIHEHFGQIYFKTTELSPEQYEQSKRITFRQLYGDISIEYSSIKFYQLVEQYKEILYADFCKNGYVTAPKSGRKIFDIWYVDMNKSKLFSYIIQMTETETNAPILGNILHYLYGKGTKLILYTYDSFLIDYDPADGTDVIGNLKRIIGSQFPVRVSAGRNYGSMVKVTI